jgi:hypothetical protein
MFHYIGTTVSAEFAAPPEELWPIVSDFTRHPELAGSGQVMQIEALTDPPIHTGSRFRAQQRVSGLDYVTISHVIVCKPPYRLAWRIGLPGTPPFAQIWHFELLPFEQGSLVEHGVVLPYVFPQLWPMTALEHSITNGEAQGMVPTLRRLADMAGIEQPKAVDVVLQPSPFTVAMLPLPLFQGSLWIAGGAWLAWRTLARARKAR